MCVIVLIIVFIIVCCLYSYINEYLSIFIYKVFIGFILGFFISKGINKYFTMNRLDKGDNNKIVTEISIFITVILVILINILSNMGIGFDLINTVYCDTVDDDVIVTDSTKSNNDKDEKNYHFSISKKFVKEGLDSVLKVLSDSLPEIIGVMGGAKIGSAIIKGSPSLPHGKRAMLGVATAGAGAIALGFGGVVIKSIRKNTEYGVGDGDDLIVKVHRASLEKMIKEGEKDFLQKNC